ncbi:unnamed protein product [Bursaphelenchus okinawaensis]|uniref:CWH43-like N-terminal domain-containing protein n=1 Tax=Bursaphelenchus okinawaensis TaxID=465554 RepID=A0A811KD60_9BILA|nr:unnamed protein product [Bursaphelenchus okinawaensis]CAG9102406.1 unnamed protein product [Bursaphelenchus okinawaensis]
MVSNKVGIYKQNAPTVHTHKPVMHLNTAFFPILSAGFGLAAFVTGYVLAVLNDHEEAWFSLISDGGALAPESCIFGILLNFSAFFWLLTCVSRHYQLLQYVHFHHGKKQKYRIMTKFMMIVGVLSGIGMSGVACFPEGQVPLAHSLSALLTFFGSVVYAWCYALMSVVVKPRIVPNWLTIFRVVAVLVVTVAFVCHQVVHTVRPFVDTLPDGTKPEKPEGPPSGILRFKPDHPYYLNHLIEAIFEWILACGSYVITATLCYELRSFEINTLTKDEQRSLFEQNREPKLVSSNFVRKL